MRVSLGAPLDQPELVQEPEQINPGSRMNMRSNLLCSFPFFSEIIILAKMIAVESLRHGTS